jgi:hypothetical protein
MDKPLTLPKRRAISPALRGRCSFLKTALIATLSEASFLMYVTSPQFCWDSKLESSRF